MKKVINALCALVLLLCAAPALEAQNVDMKTVADMPAATLLLPYFEVDLANPNGTTTVFSVNNASATAVLAHLTIWTDLGIPVYAFNIYLTGYDAQAIDMRAVLLGRHPATASAGQDPTDTISNQGVFSQDINFASCTGQLPQPGMSAATLESLRNALTGLAAGQLGGKCAGLPIGDNLARGYITVDTVNNCTLRLPNEVGYFLPGGTGDVTNQNVLWGDYYYIQFGTNQAHANPLVHIRASATDPETSVAGQYTFYGRLVGWSAADNRQPLATSFATRYMQNTLFFPNGTTHVVWRDTKVNQQPFDCGADLLWYPLDQEAFTIFDEQEQVAVVDPPPAPIDNTPTNTPYSFGAATQMLKVGTTYPVPYNRGWMYLNLNHSSDANPSEDPAAAQAWVSTFYSYTGKYAAGARAFALDSATNASHFEP